MKIELYTCWHGLKLFSKGSAFGAWIKDSESYNLVSENFKILVDESAIADTIFDGECEIVDVKSVEVVDYQDFGEMVVRNEKFKSTYNEIKDLAVDVSRLSSIVQNPHAEFNGEGLVEWLKEVDSVIDNLEKTKNVVINLFT